LLGVGFLHEKIISTKRTLITAAAFA